MLKWCRFVNLYGWSQLGMKADFAPHTPSEKKNCQPVEMYKRIYVSPEFTNRQGVVDVLTCCKFLMNTGYSAAVLGSEFGQCILSRISSLFRIIQQLLHLPVLVQVDVGQFLLQHHKPTYHCQLHQTLDTLFWLVNPDHIQVPWPKSHFYRSKLIIFKYRDPSHASNGQHGSLSSTWP